MISPQTKRTLEMVPEWRRRAEACKRRDALEHNAPNADILLAAETDDNTPDMLLALLAACEELAAEVQRYHKAFAGDVDVIEGLMTGLLDLQEGRVESLEEVRAKCEWRVREARIREVAESWKQPARNYRMPTSETNDEGYTDSYDASKLSCADAILALLDGKEGE